jgi:hypothetical protein
MGRMPLAPADPQDAHMTSRHRRCPTSLAALGAGLLALLTATGCTTLDVPRADNYPATSQKKARAVHHWDVLADDVAQRIAGTLRARAGARSDTSTSTDASPVAQPPVYVTPASDTAFNRGFRELLLTRLLDHGVPLATQPGEWQISVETQVVQHRSQVSNTTQLPFTTLAAGIAVVRDLAAYAHTTQSAVASTLAVGAVLDGMRIGLDGPAAGGPTRTEVLVTTALHNGSQYHARTADVYYIAREDAVLYQGEPKVVPTPLRQWNVVGD